MAVEIVTDNAPFGPDGIYQISEQVPFALLSDVAAESLVADTLLTLAAVIAEGVAAGPQKNISTRALYPEALMDPEGIALPEALKTGASAVIEKLPPPAATGRYQPSFCW